MSRYVNPFTEFGFKIIFGQSDSKDLLITLLNELLAGEHHITELTFLDKEDHADNINDKGIIYDLYCRTSRGEYIIVEMQNRWHSHFLDRTLYYVCRAVSRQIESPSAKEVPVPENREENPMMLGEPPLQYGKQYRLHTVYGIFLMNFKEENLEAKFRTDTVLSDRDTGKVVNPHFRQIYLQFPYFTKELADCHTLYDKLIYALKNMNNWNRMPDALKDQVFEHLARLAAVANLSEENRIAYDKALDRYRVNQIVEEDERQRERQRRKEMQEMQEIQETNKKLRKELEEAREKAIKEGIEKGIKEGIEKGMEKGEKKERLQIACQMKKDGMPIDMISKYTGLSPKDIEMI